MVSFFLFFFLLDLTVPASFADTDTAKYVFNAVGYDPPHGIANGVKSNVKRKINITTAYRRLTSLYPLIAYVQVSNVVYVAHLAYTIHGPILRNWNSYSSTRVKVSTATQTHSDNLRPNNHVMVRLLGFDCHSLLLNATYSASLSSSVITFLKFFVALQDIF